MKQKSLINVIKTRAKNENISFDAAAEKYFFEALACVNFDGCVNTPERQVGRLDKKRRGCVNTLSITIKIVA